MSEISSPGITSEHVFHTKQLFMTRLQSHSCSYMTLLRYSDDPILPLEDANSIHSMYKHGCTWVCLWNSQPCVQDSLYLDVQTRPFLEKELGSSAWYDHKIRSLYICTRHSAREIMPDWTDLHFVGRRSVNENHETVDLQYKLWHFLYKIILRTTNRYKTSIPWKYFT